MVVTVVLLLTDEVTEVVDVPEVVWLVDGQ